MFNTLIEGIKDKKAFKKELKAISENLEMEVIKDNIKIHYTDYSIIDDDYLSKKSRIKKEVQVLVNSYRMKEFQEVI